MVTERSYGNLDLLPPVLPYGLVVRIPAFHAGGPGSIPGVGTCFCHVQTLNAVHRTRTGGTELSVYGVVNRCKTHVRRPGVEPGSTAWKATMLTVTPPTHLLTYLCLHSADNRLSQFINCRLYQVSTFIYCIR